MLTLLLYSSSGVDFVQFIISGGGSPVFLTCTCGSQLFAFDSRFYYTFYIFDFLTKVPFSAISTDLSKNGE